MIIKFEKKDIEFIVREYLDELIYGIADMEVDITSLGSVDIVCIITKKEKTK